MSLVDDNPRARRRSYMREWRARNPERAAAIDRKARKAWNARNKEKNLEILRLNRRKARLDVVNFFGGKCVRCGFDDWRALQIDHINGGGFSDSRTKQSNHFFRKWINNHPKEARELYQLLCANCNWIKKHENDEFGYASRKWMTERTAERKIIPAIHGRKFGYRGEIKTLAEWSSIVGISLGSLQSRIDRGWLIEDALSTPVVRRTK